MPIPDDSTAEAATQAIRTLMRPRSVAFVGASTSYEKMSGQPVRNIGSVGYPHGTVWAVNARGEAIEGVDTVRSLADVPGDVDVGFVTVPAAACAGAIHALAAKGAKVAVVAVAGFAELGTDAGRQLGADLAQAGRETGVRIVGPVCNGIYSTPTRLSMGYNEIHTRAIRAGRVGLVSHSGALVAPFVTVLERCGAGISRYVSAGSEIDLSMADFITWLADDPETGVIALILDHVGDGPTFRRAVRHARSRGKDVVVLKLGTSPLGTEATLAHSSALSGSRKVYEAVFTADGIRSVPSLDALAFATAILSHGKRVDGAAQDPRERGVVACSTSGGGAIILADLLSDHRPRVAMPRLHADTVAEIGRHLLFGAATILNPFDLGLGGRHHYAANIMALALDPSTAVLLVFGTPMATRAKREQLAGAVADAARARPDLPVLYLSPAPLFDDEAALLEAAGVPVCGSTLESVATVAALAPMSSVASMPESTMEAVARPLHRSGPQSEHRSKTLLRHHGIAFADEHLVQSFDDAVAAAGRLGWPVVLKASGQGLWHKSEMGLVEVGLASADALSAAWQRMQGRLPESADADRDGFLVCRQVDAGVELLLGVSRDAEFGPVAVFGPGGVMAELFGAEAMRHVALPASRAMVERLIDDGPVGKLLAGFRGSPPGDRQAFVDLVMRVCGAAEAMGDALMEIDLNPVKVAPAGQGAWPLDALVVLN